MIKNKEPPYLKYWNVNNLYGWKMSQKLSLVGFKWVEETSQFNKDFIKSYNEDFKWNIFLNLMLHKLHNNSSFLPERMKIESIEKLVANLHDKKECHTQAKFKTRTKSWISFEESA